MHSEKRIDAHGRLKLLPNRANLKELISYIFWGILSLGFNFGCFYLLLKTGLDYRLANIITLILLKFFVFFTNKYFVFKNDTSTLKAVFLEFLKFLFARFGTNLLDFFGLILLVEFFGVKELYGKISLAIIVIIANFILSKWWVFKKAP